jgi:hypothetical protein
MGFNTEKALEKGAQALATAGPAAALGAAVGYGLPGSVKELRGQEEALAVVTTTLFAMLFNVMRNWWKHRVAPTA